ncbi:cytochrome B [Frigidibacter albus]|uniref:Cytochrome B n=1 Tax=Frigidibacter albus TaxID=1465486 RepID=A0A6L8VIW9_9RHOB|nr:cytochrome b/b6 domain-containing protein [Frigidibacter albus]MZQ90348.1 cytochrome B [Frigidibacter albus]NBE32154.1 cytochrome B [Frigidibacter albus]GGH58898.1 cytochrome b561 [Frigidibacter albus]
MTDPTGYSKPQIRLHWIVALLIVPQFVLHDGISAAWRALRQGQEFAFDPLVPLHVAGGLLIAALAVWRIALRSRRPAPPLPEGEHPALKFAAKVTHGGLYALLLGLPLSGAAAWFGGVEAAGDAHEVMKTLLLVLVALHVAGALFHQFVLKDGLMLRMKRPAP